MYQELYQFLLQHKQLPVPGIGTFLLERKPAVIDFPNKLILPPQYAVALETEHSSPCKKHFYCWLSKLLGMSDREAIVRFNDFAFDLKKQVSNGDTIQWDGVGTISKGFGDQVKFVPADAVTIEKPVTAEKVIREKAEHTVRVGEDERTAAEMTEMLNRPVEKKSNWWITAVGLMILAIMFIGWYLSEHGLDVTSTGNAAKLVPMEAAPRYSIPQ